MLINGRYNLYCPSEGAISGLWRKCCVTGCQRLKRYAVFDSAASPLIWRTSSRNTVSLDSACGPNELRPSYANVLPLVHQNSHLGASSGWSGVQARGGPACGDPAFHRDSINSAKPASTALSSSSSHTASPPSFPLLHSLCPAFGQDEQHIDKLLPELLPKRLPKSIEPRQRTGREHLQSLSTIRPTASSRPPAPKPAFRVTASAWPVAPTYPSPTQPGPRYGFLRSASPSWRRVEDERDCLEKGR